MKEKIKFFCLTIFYIFFGFVFIFSSFLVLLALSDIENIKKWGMFLTFIAVPFLSAYILRNHFKFLKNKLIILIRWSWEKENLYKLAIMIIAISILIIAISFI